MAAPTTTSDEAQTEAERRLRTIPNIVDADEVLVRRGRLLEADILVGIGPASFILPVRMGRIGEIEPAGRLMRPWDFAVRAVTADWLAHWTDPPRPGWHDLLAMQKQGRLTIEGNLLPFMQHLQVVKDVLAAPRGHC
jgi:hypothetical protein